MLRPKLVSILKSICVAVLLVLAFLTNPLTSHADHHEVHEVEPTEVVAAEPAVEHHHNEQIGHHNAHAEGDEEAHHGGMEPLFFIICALIVGAFIRHFLRKTPIPYTVLLLIIGGVLGAMYRNGMWEQSFPIMHEALLWAGNIDPHVILFVFLPTLIFEAAFAMDVHTFKKSVANATILAVPGIVMALVLTAVCVMAMAQNGWGFQSWDWSIALMFGAVVSATDPVAVVSLLKELGASKKLGTLIEGESLLNDGTAIVIFMVFYLPIIGEATGANPFLEFGRVAIGGALLGIITAAVCIAWVRRVFNDAMVEISVIVAAAYLIFYIAEDFMHVSGVLGLVAFGLAMAGIGRTRISPEVGHFLHEFWEYAAFIANTLIFLIVGVVIAARTEFTTNDFVMLAVVYIAIHVVRAAVIAVFYPIMKRLGYGLSSKDSYVLWYGALRGAIGLALALIIANVPSSQIADAVGCDLVQAQQIKDQFLFQIAGVVALTLLINATTIGWLVNKLGLTKIAPAKALMVYNANIELVQGNELALERMKEDRFLGRADWNAVRSYMPESTDLNEKDFDGVDSITETRRRILEKEKSSYWHQFKDGMLGPVAVRRLSDNINHILDGDLEGLSNRQDLEELWQTPGILNKLQSLPLIGKWAQKEFFQRLALSYDSANGFIEAQDECLQLLESMRRGLDANDANGQKNLDLLEEEINSNKIEGLTFVRGIRKTYPEIYDSIATKHAIRSLLNSEKKTVERLQKKGRIDGGEAAKMIESIEDRMKKLLDQPPSVKLPEKEDLLREVSWLQNVPENEFKSLASHFSNKVFATGESVLKSGQTQEGLHIIVRGTANILQGKEVIAILTKGSTIGEMAALTGKSGNHGVVAETPLTTLWIGSQALKKILSQSSVISLDLWGVAGQKMAKEILLNKAPYNQMRPKALDRMLSKGKIVTLKEGEKYEVRDQICVLVNGKVQSVGGTVEGVSLMESNLTAKDSCHLFVCEG